MEINGLKFGLLVVLFKPFFLENFAWIFKKVPAAHIRGWEGVILKRIVNVDLTLDKCFDKIKIT